MLATIGSVRQLGVAWKTGLGVEKRLTVEVPDKGIDTINEKCSKIRYHVINGNRFKMSWSTQSECDKRSAHSGRVGCNTFNCIRTFWYCYWLFF